ncbi:hypothetical protein BpHYR1_053038 [Brachionus plicatilis]|uniref:Uncharacterized protein n=1 Tax=Brachionus plicatilis TaxID=10195 RepID=A0A3M7T029_BRAPC|nr:hypothetical protein BpHYR1_053038 [Brachionus plicatilis]
MENWNLYKPWAYMYFREWTYIVEKLGAYRLILIFSPGLVCQVLRKKDFGNPLINTQQLTITFNESLRNRRQNEE